MKQPSTARISIIGAGIGGLTCARILQRHGLAVTVYDAEIDHSARNQGGSLDLHASDGQVALREAGLLDQFFAQARFDGQELRQLSPQGEVLMHDMPEPDDSSAPEIGRDRLRALLLDSLEPGTVAWGRKLDSVSGSEGESPVLTFTDGETVESDLIIGADGAFSRVRRAVSDAVPHYSGVDYLEAWFDDLPSSHPELANLVGAGSAMAADSDAALFAQRNDEDRMRVYIVRREPLGWPEINGFALADTDDVREYLLGQFEGWSPELLRLITDSDHPYADRPLYVLPAPHVWERSPSVTLLGDAAHLMPPAGVGVNLAMLDASELALSIVDADSIPGAITAYEESMLPRSTELASRLDGMADFLLADDDPYHQRMKHHR